MFYKKTGGSWVYQDGRPYVRRPGTGWTPIEAAYVKRSGVWTEFYAFDATPPQAPALAMTEEITTYQSGGQTLRGRHIRVTVRPNVVDASVRRIRLLVSPSAQPISQYDTSGYIASPDNSSPLEPWSEVYYNGYNGQERLSSVTVAREWTRNPVDATTVPAGKYFFSAWAEDFSGNWSPGRFSSITLAGFSTALPTFNARLTAQGSGTWTGASDGGSYVGGDLVQANSPQRRGVFFYGNAIRETLRRASDPEITSAQIFLHRRNDSGQDDANVYLMRHNHQTREGMPTFDAIGATKVGTIAKGESKWFDIPGSYWNALGNGDVQGFALSNRRPDDDPDTSATAKDYSVMKAVTETPRSGEVYLTFRDLDG